MEAQRRHLVVRATDYQLIAGHLYKMDLDQLLRHCILRHERNDGLWEFHAGVARGQVGDKATTRKILQEGLWWLTIHKDSKEFSKNCDVCQRVGKTLRQDELPLNPAHIVKIFYKWAIDFIGPITPPIGHSCARYIITTTEYLTRWEKAATVKDYTTKKSTRFIFENIISRF